MINSNFIEIYDEIFPLELCDRIVEKHKEMENDSSNIDSVYTSSGEEDYGGAGIRRDLSYFFHRDQRQLSSEINACLNQAAAKYCEKYPSFAAYPAYSYIVKVQKTPPKGGFHVWHCENSDSESRTRMLTWMIYLNDIPDGEGTTEFLEQGMQIAPKKGRIVLFPTGWTHTHRGNPVYSTDKYIATGWYYNQN